MARLNESDPCVDQPCDRPRKRKRRRCSAHEKARETARARERDARCSVEGCDRPVVQSRSICAAHLTRLTVHGDVLAEVPVGITAEPSYPLAHKRLRRTRGPASDYRCAAVDCTDQAREWAYIGDAPDERRDERAKNCAYSLDPDFYRPLCAPHHRQMDADTRRAERAVAAL